MIVTKKILADMLMKYIKRELKLSELVDWAEHSLMESEFESSNFETIRDILARVGLGDIQEFGLTWDDCYDYLHKLGYDIKVELVEA